MEDLKNKYEQVSLERKDILDRIKVLKEDERVKEYFSLCKKNDELANQQKDLYEKIKDKDYSSCNHLLVTVLHDYDRIEGRSYDYHGCVKCGLNEKVLYAMECFNNPNDLKPEDRKMYYFLKDRDSLDGTNTGLFCNLDLAKAIYKKIKEAHPNIDDKTAAKYLRVALHNIRNIEVSDERKVNRAKRLELKPSFNKWTKF